jgi:hypothetical protein
LLQPIPPLNQPKKSYIFIDESGDPAFYAKGKRSLILSDGFKPVLVIGMIELENKKAIRSSILQFIDTLKGDPLYNSFPCINDPKGWYLHASYDNLVIQVKFIEFLRQLEGFKFYCVIGRKKLNIFHKKHNSNETEFYFDLVSHLFKERLQKEDTFYQVYLSARNKNTQGKLKEAIDSAIYADNDSRNIPLQIKYNSEIVLSKETPELSIVDYMLWALQRYILMKDSRFFKALEKKYSLIIDLYDTEKQNFSGKSNHYHSKNPFEIEKAGEFRVDGYI